VLIDVLEWLEMEPPPRAREAGKPIEDLAGDVLRRRLKKIRKEGKQLDTLSAYERHKLRIRTKKVRYALEFFDSLFSGKRAQKKLVQLSGRLKSLQNALGSLNDFAAHREMTREAALHAPRSHRRARAFMAGIILGKKRRRPNPFWRPRPRRSGAWATSLFPKP
jgi:CHAD domain-containing protein